MGNSAIQLIRMSPLSLHHSTIMIVIVQLEGDLILFKNQFCFGSWNFLVSRNCSDSFDALLQHKTYRLSYIDGGLYSP